jgi:hypothetical protein
MHMHFETKWIGMVAVDRNAARRGRAAVDMTLDEWAQLSATRYLVYDALESRAAGANRIGD